MLSTRSSSWNWRLIYSAAQAFDSPFSSMPLGVDRTFGGCGPVTMP